jgi:homoserine dehydrogenase
MINVAVLGYGTVGSGVVEVIEKNKQKILERTGVELGVKYVLDLRDFPGDPYEDKIVHDVNVIMDDPEVAVVCEVMGGVGAAYQFSKMALERGKAVCTSNKELVAKHGTELLALARANRSNYFFEASVGGGIPIIRPMVRSLTAEKIESVVGILNGTTNYILTKMDKEGADFDAVLKEAQELGYAERNPEADVEGHDTCRKIAILSMLINGKQLDSDSIPTEGITKISPADFALAKAAGRTIRLLGVSKCSPEDVLTVRVAPFLVNLENPLAAVSDVYNGILVTGNMVGDTMYYGRGAGKLPTASAVVSDVVEAGKHVGIPLSEAWSTEKAVLADSGLEERRFMVRGDKSVINAFSLAFPGGQVLEAAGISEKAYITPVLQEKVFEEKAAELKPANSIRVL